MLPGNDYAAFSIVNYALVVSRPDRANGGNCLVATGSLARRRRRCRFGTVDRPIVAALPGVGTPSAFTGGV